MISPDNRSKGPVHGSGSLQTPAWSAPSITIDNNITRRPCVFKVSLGETIDRHLVNILIDSWSRVGRHSIDMLVNTFWPALATVSHHSLDILVNDLPTHQSLCRSQQSGACKWTINCHTYRPTVSAESQSIHQPTLCRYFWPTNRLICWSICQYDRIWYVGWYVNMTWYVNQYFVSLDQ